MEIIGQTLTLADYTTLVTEDRPVLVDFYADWCEPCVFLDEILTELELRMKDSIRILKVDFDQQPELARHFGFRSVPWLLLYNKGIEVWRMHGFMMAPELEKVIREHNPGFPAIT